MPDIHTPDTYRAELAADFGDAYTAVIAEAGRRQYILLGSAPPGGLTAADQLDPNLAARHLDDVVMLAGVRAGAAAILRAAPRHMHFRAADSLAGVHIGRMARYLREDV